MEEEPDASESGACDSAPHSPSETDRQALRSCRFTFPNGFSRRLASRLDRPVRVHASVTAAICLLCLAVIDQPTPVRAGGLERIRQAGTLRYGSDMEGGGPYAYPDPSAPGGVTGFEVELMSLLARDLKVQPVFSYGPWDKLLQLLDSRRVDVVVNGYEWTSVRSQSYLATRPYYVYQLQLLARRGGNLQSWSDVRKQKPGGGRWTVAVLVGSAAETYATEEGGDTVEVIRCDGSTDAMTLVQNGQYDATLQDLPAARFYQSRFPGLKFAGALLSHGYYVIFSRTDEPELRDALDRGLERLTSSGELRRIYEKYGIWTEAQEELAAFHGPVERVNAANALSGWPLLRRYQSRLLEAAKVTVILSVSSMPIAMAAGLLIAIGRIYGKRWLSLLLQGYVELIRGTPLMLQLYVLFYLLRLDPWVAGIAGLAINYSAYEAEIYRAGLQAIPVGQMEAALALGMSRRMALRRVIVPQAVRMVIPPVTNDFIALFKDTSVCSVVTLVELTKEYSTLANSTGGAIEFALAAATLYMLMSVPLSWFSRWSERYLGGTQAKGGALI
jgi:polar amino acid transport system substrate-binding protein